VAFDYDKIKSKEEGGTHWASYSDLFMVLSVIFLLLYVVSSIKSGSFNIQKHIQYQKMVRENENLKSQITSHNALNEEYLKNEASNKEKKTYQLLMSKLDLLQDDAQKERDRLLEESKDNEAKRQALNEYQSIIKGIIDANVSAKHKIKRRDIVIERKREALREKEDELADSRRNIEQLKGSVFEKEKQITLNEMAIENVKNELSKSIEKIESERNRAQLSKVEFEKKIQDSKRLANQQIESIKAKSTKYEQELQATKSDLAGAETHLMTVTEQLQKEKEENEKMVTDYRKNIEDQNRQIAQMKSEHEEQVKSERRALLDEIKKEKLSKNQKAKRLAEFKKDAVKKEKELSKQIQDMENQVAKTENALETAKKEETRYLASLDDLKKEKEGLSKDLKAAKAKATAKKKIVSEIQKAFQKAGVNAKVDPGTGDVVLSFGDEYFDMGSSKLKDGMATKLKRFMPIYAESLFKDKNIAKKIENVEIVGFASSTFRNKYVNPQSLRPEDQEAINFNLKLSFDRANSIFRYAFDPRKVEFEHQRTLLPKIKVVGRGFLPDGENPSRVPAGVNTKDFCSKYDCKKAQRVIVKFNLKD